MLPASAQSWLELPDGQNLPLNGNLTLGRSQSNSIVIAAERASRKHASIHAQDGEFWLIDLGSSNGTYRNGNRVFQPVRLGDGDKIDIAGHLFTFTAAKSDAADDFDSEIRTVAAIPQITAVPCWLLVADIEDFTRLSQQLDPEQLAMAVGQWVRASREITERHGGVVNKYLGDGYLAFWRDQPGASESVAAALVENQTLQRADGLRFRLVLHHGDVIFGGSASVGEESLMGPEVNFVFRMEKVAGGLHIPIMMSRSAAERMKGAELDGVSGEHELKGFSGAHRFYAFKNASASVARS